MDKIWDAYHAVVLARDVLSTASLRALAEDLNRAIDHALRLLHDNLPTLKDAIEDMEEEQE